MASCNHAACNKPAADAEVTVEEVQEILKCMAEQGKIVLIGHDDAGEPVYKLVTEDKN